MLNSSHIVLSVAWQDAGDTTRAIAMATALREQCPPELEDRLLVVWLALRVPDHQRRVQDRIVPGGQVVS